MSPHCSMEASLAALSASPLSFILAKSPVMETV